MLPYVDSPRDATHRPWATGALIVLNVGIHLALLVSGAHEQAVLDFGFYVSNPALETSLSSMFLHGGLAHLLGNMLYLWIYGPNVEARVGRLGFVALYLASGMLGDVLSCLVSFHALPSVGASGAIAGLLGAYLLLFPSNRVEFFFVPFSKFSLPAWLVLSWFFITNLIPVVFGLESDVGHGAHLGGFLMGFGLALGVWVTALFHPVGESKTRKRLDRALALWKQGSLVDAESDLVRLANEGGAIGDEAGGHLAELRRHPFFVGQPQSGRV